MAVREAAAAALRQLVRGSDDTVLALLRSPRPPLTQANVVEALLGDGRYRLVERAVQEGVVEPNLPLCQASCTLVHAAADRGDIGMLRCLIVKHGVDPNSQTTNGWPVLHMAISRGLSAAALWLINEVPAVDIEAATDDGATPLVIAAKKGVVEVLKALVAKGVDIDRMAGEHAASALGYAIFARQEAAALYLLEAGASWCGGYIEPLDRALGLVGEGQEEMAKDGALLIVVVQYGLAGVIKYLVRRLRTQTVPPEILAKFMAEAARNAIDSGTVPSLEALMEGGLDVVEMLVDVEVEGGGS